MPGDPLLEPDEAKQEFGLPVVKQPDENEMRVREPMMIGPFLDAPQEALVALAELLAEAQRGNPVPQVERANLRIAVDVSVQQLIADPLPAGLEAQQRVELPGADLVGRENPRNRVARRFLRAYRVAARQ